jgi:hypothetical protein
LGAAYNSIKGTASEQYKKGSDRIVMMADSL